MITARPELPWKPVPGADLISGCTHLRIRHCFICFRNAIWRISSKDLFLQKVRLLWEYDKEHQTEFYKTLKVYLENNENAVKSARKLFIHRSTFLYRLERIKEMTGLDLNDPNMHLYCLLSYRILELYYGDKKSTK